MKILQILPASFTLFLAAACGGGSSNDEAGGGGLTPPPSNGTVRAGMAIGPISSFGSVIVNGVRYDTDDADVTIDGAAGTPADLRVGQVVSILAELEDGQTSGAATSVSFDDNVDGPIETLDAAASMIVVLGQTVRIGADTSFDDSIQPRSLAGLAVGDFVEVSGLVRSDGSIDATRIEKNAIDGELEVHGIVSVLDTANQRFNINALVVDYSSAQLEDFPDGQIAEGQPVEVEGAALDANGALVATRVEYEGALIVGDEDDFAEIEGFITRFVSVQDFDVSGVPVTTNAATEFEDGTSADLGLNVKVEVEGIIDGNGRVLADEVDIRLDGDIEIAGLIDAVDAARDSFVVLGIAVDVDALTRFEDQSGARIEPLTLADLNVGDYIEVRGAERADDNGRVLAAILERDDIDSDVELQGFVSAVTAPTFTVLGVTIQTDGSTAFQDANDSTISSAEFFSRVAAGSLVNADGLTTSSTAILADEVELKD